MRLLEEIGRGKRGRPPASIVLLSGDVHHAYLAEVAFRLEKTRGDPKSDERRLETVFERTLA